ncbi:kinetochore protein Spc25 isoform X2 [Pantherophis guttatus]|uniref:Kinetochore protein SPC25 n=1 Tax=Pantherophis guttatus TaxID=94885 RepID=A0A6P9CHP6_PANGU|nr:kinetochore protein Spc25 isoform X2 [Pantherophis guttatus]
MMAEMKDDNDELAMLEKDIKEFWTKFKTICCHGPIDQVLGLRDSWYESINSLSDKWSKRLKEGDEIINKFHEYTNEVCVLNKSIEEKQAKISTALSKITDEEKEKTDLMNSIQELKEELIQNSKSKHKKAEETEERLLKAEKLFKERLGLEIRKTCVVSCSPPLDCTEELQQKVRETNNFSAFIANVRKAFIALTYK